MNRERLTKMRDMLRNLTPEERKDFDLETWRRSATCGFSACACGWFAIKHPEQGLYLKRTPHGAWQIAAGALEGWKAVEEVFGLSERDAEILFMAEEYDNTNDPDAVADRIDKLLSEQAAAGGAR